VKKGKGRASWHKDNLSINQKILYFKGVFAETKAITKGLIVKYFDNFIEN
jgi:hypothetical protein